MSEKEDEEVTKILNLNDLKKNTEDETIFKKIIELYLLDYKTDFFTKNEEKFKAFFSITIIKSLDDLRKLTRQFPKLNLALYYNENPNVTNALLKQFNEHYPGIQSIVIAENLSPEKVALHQAQPFSAKHYHDIATDIEDLAKKLE